MNTITLQLTDAEYQLLRDMANSACLTYLNEYVDINKTKDDRDKWGDKYDAANAMRDKIYGYINMNGEFVSVKELCK